MTLSLSVCVRVFICVSLFILLVSLEFYLVLICFNGVSRVFQEYFGVSRMFPVSFKGVYKKFQEILKGV